MTGFVVGDFSPQTEQRESVMLLWKLNVGSLWMRLLRGASTVDLFDEKEEEFVGDRYAHSAGGHDVGIEGDRERRQHATTRESKSDNTKSDTRSVWLQK